MRIYLLLAILVACAVAVVYRYPMPHHTPPAVPVPVVSTSAAPAPAQHPPSLITVPPMDHAEFARQLAERDAAAAQADEAAARRRRCGSLYVTAGEEDGIRVQIAGSGIEFRSPNAGGIMAQAMANLGVLDGLAACGFSSATFADGAYFFTAWNVPLQSADADQININARWERDDYKKLGGAVIPNLAMVGGVARCQGLYPGDSAAFEACKQGVITRAVAR